MLSCVQNPEAGTQASRLISDIESILSQAQVAYKDLDHILVCVGPGSFTGIRIGVAAAQAIAFANQLPLQGITSFALAALEQQQKHATTECLLAQYAGKNQWYVQRFSQLHPTNEIELAEHAPENSVLIGQGGISPDVAMGAVALQHFPHLLRAATPLYIREADVTQPAAAPS